MRGKFEIFRGLIESTPVNSCTSHTVQTNRPPLSVGFQGVDAVGCIYRFV
jgi:hypothetical protein